MDVLNASARDPSAAALGTRARSRGCGVDVKGYGVDVKGYGVEFKDDGVDVKGYELGREGGFIDCEGHPQTGFRRNKGVMSVPMSPMRGAPVASDHTTVGCR
eukprot:472383-Pyramimonas_sp.AAC.1